MVSLTIDGKQVSVPAETTILEAAQKVGIKIPTLCWLQKVSPTGACRVCAVEIKGIERTMTACNTPVKDGIEVTTQSEALTKIRKQIMELILVNHPLDCPVCDAGGECDLQNTCYELEVNRQEFRAEDVNPETIDHWPLIQQVPNRCVMCEKCVKVCHEVVGASSLFVNDKGDRAFIDKDLESCEFCGNCVSVCPTGTMISKPFKFKARPWALRKVPTVCTHCGSHCQIDLNVQGGEIFRITSDDEGTTNNGNLCTAGFFGYGYINSPQRLRAPLVDQQPASWGVALSHVTDAIEQVVGKHGAGAVAGLSSPRLTNEENYLFQKLFRAAIGSNNIDSEARYGALRALKGLDSVLGLHGASNLISSIGSAEAVLVFGADPTAEAPAIDWKIQEATRRKSGKLILANMRKVKLQRFANSFLNYRPGSEIDLANVLGRLLVDNGLVDEDYLNRMVGNLDELKSHLAGVDLAQAVAATGIELAQLEDAAQMLGKASTVALIFGADISKSERGEEKAAALANLAILTGALRGDAGGLFPLDEKGNMQGLLDMGVYPEALPGYLPYAENSGKFGKAWNAELPKGGLDADGILQGIENGQVRFLYLAATNPLSFPNASRWRKALEKVDCLVVQDILPNELTELATVVLPGTTFAEKNGSVTSLDHRVRPLERAIRPVGDAREDWEIFADLYARLTRTPLTFSRADILSEVSGLSGLYGDICFVGNERNRPCLKQPFSPADKSFTYRAVSGSEPVEGLQLLSGKSIFHFGTTSTWSDSQLELVAEGKIEINPEDASVAGIKDGEAVKLSSRTGVAFGRVVLSESVPAGLLFAPYHFTEQGIQQLLQDGSNRAGVTISKA
ncbi:MAG: molybdopterin-dependent oxidoreductase [Desulfuromonadales bacterium]|nr:molybdopterin-dependent oxidoreductase [Desulfuromonadales bacterium]